MLNMVDSYQNQKLQTANFSGLCLWLLVTDNYETFAVFENKKSRISSGFVIRIFFRNSIMNWIVITLYNPMEQ